MHRGSVSLLVCLCAAAFYFQTVFGVGIGLLEIPLECYMRLKAGDGNKMETRYYYKQETSRCRRFTYSGQNGNDNNFKTLQECMETCKGLAATDDDPAVQNLIMATTNSPKIPAAIETANAERASIEYWTILSRLIGNWKRYVRSISKS